MIWVALFTVKDEAFVPPNVTAVALLKPVPAITTTFPPASGPRVGLTAVTVGGLGR